MELDEIRKLKREEIIQLAVDEVCKIRPEFDPAPFDRVKVVARPQSVQVDFEASVRFIPLDGSLTEKSYCFSVSFSGEKTLTHIPENLLVPTDEYRKVMRFFGTGGWDDTRIYQQANGYEVTVSHQEGGAEGYSLDIETGKMEMIWHEHPEPDVMEGEL